MSTLKLEEISYQYKNGDRRVVNKVSCLFGSERLAQWLALLAAARPPSSP
jgi:hypothetical protein